MYVKNLKKKKEKVKAFPETITISNTLAIITNPLWY